MSEGPDDAERMERDRQPPPVTTGPPYPLDRATLERECELSFLRGSGPGGQHRNKVETGVRLVHPRSGLVVIATDHRSQHRNRELAFERLTERLEARNRVPKKRKRTRKPRSADRKRLDAKKRRSETKRRRRNSGDD